MNSGATNMGHWTGPILGLTSAALFGLSTPLAKQLLGGVDPWLLAAILYLGAGLGLFALRQFGGRSRTEAPLRRADLPWLAGAVLVGGVIGPVLLMFGLASTPASSAALLHNIESLATMGIAWLVFRENVDLRIGAGAAAILLGAIVLSWQGGPTGLGLGALAIVGACLAWGVDNNLTRKIAGADPVQITMIKGLSAGVVNLALAFALGANAPTPILVIVGGLVGFAGYGLSIVLFILALRHVGAARTGAYFSTAPFLGAALSVLMLGEPITLQLIAAALLMGVGVYLHVAERHEHEHTHAAMEHEHAHTHDAHHQHTHGPLDPPSEPHAHRHSHNPITHSHPHFPDLHHDHAHGKR
jgi:drug/metabolite transporter (DMT)-like permease